MLITQVHKLFTNTSWLVHHCKTWSIWLALLYLLYFCSLTCSFFLHGLSMTCSGLALLFSITSSRLVYSFLWLVHDLFMACSDLFRRFTKFVHDLFMACLLLVFECLWFVHRHAKTCDQFNQGSQKCFDICPWLFDDFVLTHELFSPYSWLVHSFHDLVITSLQSVLDLFIICSQLVHKFLMTSWHYLTASLELL